MSYRKVSKPRSVLDFVVASVMCGMTVAPTTLFAAEKTAAPTASATPVEKRVIDVMQLTDQDPDPDTGEKAFPDSVVVKQTIFDAQGRRQEQMSCMTVAHGSKLSLDVIYVGLDIERDGTRTTFTGQYNPGDAPTKLWTQYGPHAQTLVQAPSKMIPDGVFRFMTASQKEAEKAVSRNLYNNCSAIVADANALIASGARSKKIAGELPTTRYELSGTMSAQAGDTIIRQTDLKHGCVLQGMGLYR